MLLPILALVAACVFLPLLQAARLLRLQESSRLGWLLAAADATVFVAVILLVGRWDIAGFGIRFVLVAILMAAMLRSWLAHRRLPWRAADRAWSGRARRTRWASAASLLVFGALLAWLLAGLAPPAPARDMALLGMALRRRFQQHYHYFSDRDFVFRGKQVRGHNDMLGRVAGVDGIKTGYIRASGFNIVTSYNMGGRQLVVVVMGADTARQRNDHAEALLQDHLHRRGIRQVRRAVGIGDNHRLRLHGEAPGPEPALLRCGEDGNPGLPQPPPHGLAALCLPAPRLHLPGQALHLLYHFR